jgi:hypothetical protein
MAGVHQPGALVRGMERVEKVTGSPDDNSVVRFTHMLGDILDEKTYVPAK